MTIAHPLQWPPGWSRTPAHKRVDSRYRFKRTRAFEAPFWRFAEARDTLFDELQRLGGKLPVLSTNFPSDRYGCRQRASDG